MSQRDVIFQCRIVAAELRSTNSNLKIGGGLRRNRGGVQRGGVRPPGSLSRQTPSYFGVILGQEVAVVALRRLAYRF